jgi:hypothetical protein
MVRQVEIEQVNGRHRKVIARDDIEQAIRSTVDHMCRRRDTTRHSTSRQQAGQLVGVGVGRPIQLDVDVPGDHDSDRHGGQKARPGLPMQLNSTQLDS